MKFSVFELLASMPEKTRQEFFALVRLIGNSPEIRKKEFVGDRSNHLVTVANQGDRFTPVPPPVRMAEFHGDNRAAYCGCVSQAKPWDCESSDFDPNMPAATIVYLQIDRLAFGAGEYRKTYRVGVGQCMRCGLVIAALPDDLVMRLGGRAVNELFGQKLGF